MPFFRTAKHARSDDISKLPKGLKKVKTEKQKANRRQGKVIDLKTEKQSTVKRSPWF